MTQDTSSAPITMVAPHTHDRSSVERIMLQVCLALTPATLFGLWQFGWPAAMLWLLTCASAVATEVLCLWLRRKPLHHSVDLSALLTGWLLALSLPPWAPWWIGVGGSFFAIAVGKHLYGGIGQNIFNPAMLARIALLVSFPVQMTTWPLAGQHSPDFITSLGIIFQGAPMPDGTTGATILGELKTAYSGDATVTSITDAHFSWLDAGLGFTAGSLGETSALLILAGGIWLLALRIISWHIPVAMLLSLLLISALFNAVDPGRYAGPMVHLLSGGTLLGAFFIATDYVTSPSSNSGRLWFGACCGVLVFAIRSWGGFPEGVGFAVLFMNALTPLLDRYCKPRAYGRNVAGKALKVRNTTRRIK